MKTATPSVLRERTLLGWAVATAVVFVVFAAGAKEHRLLGSADESVWRFWSEHGVDVFHNIAEAITSIGVVSYLIPLSLVTGAIAFAFSKSAAYSLAPFFSVQITAIVVSGLKDFFDASRPPASSHIVVAESAAFPSGHAANTAALVIATVLIWRLALPSDRVHRHAPVIGFIIVVLMALTRLVLNVHWLSDVLGGIALGASISLVVCVIVMRTHTMLKSL